MNLTARVEEWRQEGGEEQFRGRRIHVFRRGQQDPLGDPPVLLLLHGFPSSSYDWRPMLESGEVLNAVIAFDFLGFGLSEKPREHDYTLAWQADLAEELVRRHAGGREVFICAHDMGTSVATELFARDLEGRLSMSVSGALLFNGSMILDLASPTAAQKLLRRPRLGPAFARLSSRRIFRQQFGSIFSPAHPLSSAEADDQWSLICLDGGRTLGHKLIAYMDERVRYAERWHGAIRDWPGRLSFAWGMRDPVATPSVLDGLRKLRPAAPVIELPELGHYPQIEDPAALTAALGGALAAVG